MPGWRFSGPSPRHWSTGSTPDGSLGRAGVSSTRRLPRGRSHPARHSRRCHAVRGARGLPGFREALQNPCRRSTSAGYRGVVCHPIWHCWCLCVHESHRNRTFVPGRLLSFHNPFLIYFFGFGSFFWSFSLSAAAITAAGCTQSSSDRAPGTAIRGGGSSCPTARP